MSHKCVRCGAVYEDNDATILRGCKCGSIFFLYIRSPEDSQRVETLKQELEMKDTTLEKEIEKKIAEKEVSEKFEGVEGIQEKIVVNGSRKKAEVEEIKFGVETIRVPREGVYEINLEALMGKQPIVILERGRVYFIHLPSVFDKVKERE
jgi:hypothetical protein